MISLYILRCKDNYLYTGITNNIENRLDEHRFGKCPLTKNRQPIELVYTEEFENRINAAKREKEIKGWNKSKKEKLIESHSNY